MQELASTKEIVNRQESIAAFPLLKSKIQWSKFEDLIGFTK